MKNAKKVVTFGEIMMRLNPRGNERFLQAESFEVSYAGGEANVAVSLANYGMKASFVTKVPAHEIGQCALNALRRFEGADWFHWTGITPALGGNLPEICLAACQAAKAKGITVSCDLNFRKKLWTSAQANEVMSRLMPYVDVCIANEEDAKDVFGIEAENTDIDAGKIDHQGYISVARQLSERFGFRKVAITLRGSISASDNDWAAMLYENGEAVFSPTYRIHIVDRVGGGDSFGGGLIYSQLVGKSNQDAINFAVAASCLKHTIEHDFNLVSVAEVESLAGGNASGRVQR